MSRDNEDGLVPQDEAPTMSITDSSSDADRGGRSGGTSNDGGEFSPGQIIAGRFRIVGHLGSGGMGDVFRADDLELGASAALKFLPVGLAGDPVRLERLRNEVRLARQVAHPNVCRVYDIGDADGRPFLSMEFIDGEDLASLLRRIGRLAKDKAIELAREICAGVAAAHELGVVHRDLKPANVMIDGRGRARVADFGLAGTIEDLGGGRDAMAGTPAYMAPEQLRGAGATKQTDIYALGLVLYELFTGKRAHDVTALAELKERHSSSTPPTSPSDLVEDMDPTVERAIMHCLALDPEDRPASVLAVMVALPGGDPLAAMLKAGEMPSPELVAASGRRGTLKPTRAFQLGAIVFFCIAVSLWIFGRPSFFDTLGGVLAPEILAHRANVLLADFGYEIEGVDSAWGFDLDWYLALEFGSLSRTDRRTLLRSEVRPVLRFWYRTSPVPMAPWHGSLPGLYVGNLVTPEDPPLSEAGMALVRLGPRGALLELRVAPGSLPSTSIRTKDQVLTAIIHAAELDPSHVERIEWSGISPMPGTSTAAWQVVNRQGKGISREIVATFAGDRPTWVRIDPSPMTGDGERPTRSEDWLGLVFFAFFAGGALIAVLNIRAGRWDRRGAARLAIVAFVLCFSSQVIGSHHPLSAEEEVRGLFSSVAYAATRALMTWLLYVAIEPFIRKLHPKLLVSWSRLLAGRVCDPAVGRDVLVGLAVVSLQIAIFGFWFWSRGLRGYLMPVWAYVGGETPLEMASSFAITLRQPVVSVGSTLGFLLTYVGIRWMLGRFNRVAPLLLWVAIFLFMFGGYTIGQEILDRIAVAAIPATAFAYLAGRHGLLSFVIFAFVSEVFLFTMVTLDPTDWYFAPTAIFVVLVATLTVFGVWASTNQKEFLSRP